MTDTEILDYLQESLTMQKRLPADVLIGSVFFTTGLRPGTLRQLIVQAIEVDKVRTVKQVTKELRR